MRNLSQVNALGIQFITLRQRNPKMLREIHQQPRSGWRRFELESTGRVRIVRRGLWIRRRLREYDGLIRRIVVTNLGYE